MYRKVFITLILAARLIIILLFYRYFPSNFLFFSSFPTKESFDFNYSYDQKSYSKGDKITLNANLKNQNGRSYFVSTIGFNIIDIIIQDVNDSNEVAFPSISTLSFFSAGSSVNENYEYIFEKTGTYRILINCQFDIEKNGKVESYFWKEEITLDVK